LGHEGNLENSKGNEGITTNGIRKDLVGGELDGCYNRMDRWQPLVGEGDSSMIGEMERKYRGVKGFRRRGEFWGKDIRKASA